MLEVVITNSSIGEEVAVVIIVMTAVEVVVVISLQ